MSKSSRRNRSVTVQSARETVDQIPFTGHLTYNGEMIGYWLPKGVTVAQIDTIEGRAAARELAKAV